MFFFLFHFIFIITIRSCYYFQFDVIFYDRRLKIAIFLYCFALYAYYSLYFRVGSSNTRNTFQTRYDVTNPLRHKSFNDT